MATKYLLPCDCGSSLRIEVSQAGQTVRCECGKKHELPTMRAIRQLEEDTSSAAPQVIRRWNPLLATLFASGCLVTVAGLAIAVVSHVQYVREVDQIPPLPTAEVREAWVSEVDQMSAVEAWEEWKRSKAFTVPPLSLNVALKRHANDVLQRALIAYGIAGVGLLLVGSAVVLGSARKKS
jgi:hypothetical protein